MRNIVKRFWPVIAIVAVWILFSAPYFFKGLVPVPSTYLVTFFPPWSASYGMPVKNNAMPDVLTQIYPWKHFTIETWKQGSLPLWNPYSFSGTTHAGNYQSAVFSPMNLLFFLIPHLDAWSIMILLQPLLAALFMYLFLRSMARSKEASLMGGFAFMFCGFIVVWMAYGTLAYAALFLPLVFYAVHSGWKKYSLWKHALVSLGIACSFFSGHFQISLYVAIAAAAYITYQTWQTKKFTTGLRYLAFFFLGVGIALPQLLLTLHAYAQSVRSGDFVKGEVIPWQYLITIFAPDFYGNPVTRNDWFGHYAEWAGYIGVIPLLLALLSMTVKKGRPWFFIIGSVVTLAFALPTPLTDLLFWLKIPVLSTSAASRIIILTSFFLATASSYGLDHLKDLWKKGESGVIVRFILLIGFALGGLWLFLLLAKPLAADKLVIAKRNLVLPSVLVIVAFIMFLAGLIKRWQWARILPFVVCLIVGIDMYRFAAKWMPFDPRGFVYPEEKSLSFLKEHIGNDRVFGNIGNEVATMFRLPVIEGYDAMYQARYGEFINAVSHGEITRGGRSVVQLDKHGDYTKEAIELLGVRYIYHRVSDGRQIWAFPFWEYGDDMKQVYNDEVYWIYEYNKAFPRAFLASSYIVEQDKKKTVDTLFARDFDRRETLILEQRPEKEPQPGEGQATIVTYDSQKIVIQTTSPAAKLLFLSDVYDPGWSAWVDGKRSRIYRADYAFRAVWVPAGTHTVQFIYWPERLTFGLAVAGISCMMIVGMWIKQTYDHRHL